MERTMQINPLLDRDLPLSDKNNYFNEHYRGKHLYSKSSGRYMGIVTNFEAAHIILDNGRGRIHLEGIEGYVIGPQNTSKLAA